MSFACIGFRLGFAAGVVESALVADEFTLSTVELCAAIHAELPIVGLGHRKRSFDRLKPFELEGGRMIVVVLHSPARNDLNVRKHRTACKNGQFDGVESLYKYMMKTTLATSTPANHHGLDAPGTTVCWLSIVQIRGNVSNTPCFART